MIYVFLPSKEHTTPKNLHFGNTILQLRRYANYRHRKSGKANVMFWFRRFRERLLLRRIARQLARRTTRRF